MPNNLKQMLGWVTPLIPAFDLPTLGLRLGYIEGSTCLARKQGHCPGKYHCADCAWSEGPLREPR